MNMRDLSKFKRMPGGKRPPWLLKFRSSTGFIISAVWMSTFTVCQSPISCSGCLRLTETQLRSGIPSICHGKQESTSVT